LRILHPRHAALRDPLDVIEQGRGELLQGEADVVGACRHLACP
jgi:hypothetical protein